jgi:hypothetical protein
VGFQVFQERSKRNLFNPTELPFQSAIVLLVLSIEADFVCAETKATIGEFLSSRHIPHA